MNPGPLAAGPPPIYLAALGPVMFQAAAAVADGALIHPIHTREYLRTVAEPAIARGLAESGRSRGHFTLSATVLCIIDEDAGDASREAVRRQFAFYASTPAYRPVLDLHGWQSLSDRLRGLVRRGEHDAMAAQVPDEILDTFCVAARTWDDAIDLAALTVLPALLAVLGPKVNSLRIRRSVQRTPAAEASGGWYRLAHSVMRRPVLYAVPIVLVLLGLASPFLKVVWGGVDATVLPASAAPRIVTEALNTDFPGNPTAPIETIVQFAGPIAGSPGRAAGLTAYVSRLGHVPGVTGARLTGIRGDIARIDMTYGPGPYTPQARTIAGHVRDVAAPPGATAYTGGQTAALADELSSLGHTLPWMALAVVLATFLLMFLAFGSLVLPVQAIVMTILSLGAMFGVVTWIFQDGHLSGLLAYVVAWAIIPAEGEKASIGGDLLGKTRHGSPG